MTEKQPVYILPENIQRIIGRDAQRNNILAARLVAETVKTTLGPKGMDKMLVDNIGDITITNDGVTILEQMEIEHPAAKMMVEIAKTQEEKIGDGTTTAVILAGKLLENAEKLLDERIHPTVIVRGYTLAAKQAKEIAKDLAVKIIPTDKELLKKIVSTAITGKGAEASKESLSDVVVEAVTQVMEKTETGISVDKDNIKIEKRKGEGIEDTELIRGIVLDKARINTDMPCQVKGAKIALIDAALELKSLEGNANIQITSPEQFQNFLDQEEKSIQNMVDKIKKSGANVVLCQKGIDDVAQYYLAKAKIYAVRRIKKSDMEKLAKATSGKIVSNINDLSPEDLGKAAQVKEVKDANEGGLTYVTGCDNPKAITILIRGGTEHVLDELERAIKDGIGDVAASLEFGYVVAGGGAFEMELLSRLKKFSNSVKGREQLAVNAFADSLEVIPRTLAENAGLDPIDVLAELKSRHDKAESKAGLDLSTNNEMKVTNTLEAGIVEPLEIKIQAIKSATEVATMILRIDDVIAAGKGSRLPQGTQGMEMGGMD